MHLSYSLAYLCLAAAVSIVAACIDIKRRIIPNALTLPVLVLALGTHLITGGTREFLGSLAGSVIAASLFTVFFLAGGMGGGDVKLATAVCALAALPDSILLLELIAISGGVIAVIVSLKKKALIRTAANVGMLVAHHRQAGLMPHPQLNVRNSADTLRIPYGIAIAFGCLFTVVIKALNG